MRVSIAIVVFIVWLGGAFLVFADRSSSTNFIIERGVVNIGGVENSTSGGFTMQGSIGQIGTGISSSTSFVLKGGFLNFFVPVPAVLPPTPPTVPGETPGLAVGGGGGTGYYVRPSVVKKPPPTLQCIDFNGDGRIDIVDLSIMLFYYNKKGTDLGCYDLNQNNVVDFPDVSILMYYWTS